MCITPIMESAKEVDISEVDSHGFYPARDESVYLNRPHWPYAEPPIEFDKEIGLQRAIDLAEKKQTSVSFPCSLSNKKIREAEVDWKGCGAFKSTPESDIVVFGPYSIFNSLFG